MEGPADMGEKRRVGHKALIDCGALGCAERGLKLAKAFRALTVIFSFTTHLLCPGRKTNRYRGSWNPLSTEANYDAVTESYKIQVEMRSKLRERIIEDRYGLSSAIVLGACYLNAYIRKRYS